MGELEVSMREIELAFTKSLCNQLRLLERGITKPNVRELVLLRKFLADSGDEQYILGGNKVLIEVQQYMSREQEFVDSCSTKVCFKAFHRELSRYY